MTSDLVPPGRPNPQPRATLNGCGWKKGGRTERGRKERGCSAPHRWRQRPRSGHPGTRHTSTRDQASRLEVASLKYFMDGSHPTESFSEKLSTFLEG